MKSDNRAQVHVPTITCLAFILSSSPRKWLVRLRVLFFTLKEEKELTYILKSCLLAFQKRFYAHLISYRTTDQETGVERKITFALNCVHCYF